MLNQIISNLKATDTTRVLVQRELYENGLILGKNQGKERFSVFCEELKNSFAYGNWKEGGNATFYHYFSPGVQTESEDYLRGFSDGYYEAIRKNLSDERFVIENEPAYYDDGSGPCSEYAGVRSGKLKVGWIHQGSSKLPSTGAMAEFLLLQTTRFAEEKHRTQVRAGDKKIPYITHPLAVAMMVAEVGGSTETICAALLHDTIEDCEVKDEEILALYPQDVDFGQRVLSIVKEMTDPEGLPYEQKKERQIAMMASGYSKEAALLKVADQTCNMQDLVATPPNWGEGEEEAYIASMKKLVDARKDINQNIKKMFERAHEAALKFYGTKS